MNQRKILSVPSRGEHSGWNEEYPPKNLHFNLANAMHGVRQLTLKRPIGEYMHPTPAMIGSAIEGIVSTSPARRMKGASLGLALRRAFPEFFVHETGLKLSAFVRTYSRAVSYDPATDEYSATLTPSGSSSLISHPKVQINSSPIQYRGFHVPRAVWAAFSSSRGQSVVVNTKNPELAVVERNMQSGSDWQTIQSLTQLEHQQFAKDFIDKKNLPTELKLYITDKASWQKEFFVGLPLAERDQWRLFHNAEVLKKLVDRLQEKGVAYKDLKSTPAIPLENSEKASESDSSLSDIRSLAIQLIQQLSCDRLRDLRFSLGELVDAVKAGQSG